MAEADLYLPVKRFLEAQGYVVKGEVKECDVVAVRGEEAPVIIELKSGFSLQLLLQRGGSAGHHRTEIRFFAATAVARR